MLRVPTDITDLKSKPRWLRQTLKDLDRHEGFEEFAYPDPLSVLAKKYPARKYGWGKRPARQILAELGEREINGQPWTVGHGFTHGVTPDSRITREQSLKRLEPELIEHVKGLYSLYHDWDKEPLFVSTVLANMAFNMGTARLSKFAPTLAVLKAHKYEEAAARLEKTAWYKQVGVRSKELVARLRNQMIAPEHIV